MNEVVPVIEMQHVDFAYSGVPVLEDATFRIQPGSFVSVVGPNGGGKTTLLKLILGLLKPQRGTVRVLGQPPREACGQIGYMPQSANVDLRFPTSTMDLVLMGRAASSRWFGPYGRADRQAAGEALQAVNLADLADRHIGDLSGGQRQRALIARAIVSRPNLLLLDEPTSNLDMRAGEELYDLLSGLNERMAILLVSHDMEYVSSRVDTVLCVQQRVAIHPTEEVTDTVLQDLYGGGVRRVQHRHDCIERGCEGQVHQ
jgi:zinc transport system ATP-binding protein